MTYIAPLVELSMVGVEHPGIPGRERLLLRPTETIQLAHYGVILSRRKEGYHEPIGDLFFWFGEKEVQPPGWIVLLTGVGENKTFEKEGQTIHLFFWNKPHTFFHDAAIVPIVFRIAGALFGKPFGPPQKQIQNS